MPASVAELLELCANADVLVTTRFHGAVFGVITARPTLAICYQAKTREVLETAGLGAHAIALEQLSSERLRAGFDRLRAERRAVEAELRRHTIVLRARLDQQYQEVAALLRRESRHAASLPPSRQPEVAGTRS